MYKTEESILAKSKEALGKRFEEFDINNRLKNGSNKGNLGQIIEEGLFGYKINSDKNADFADANVELKVTPFKRNKNGSYSAKERLVLNIIDYISIANSTFYESDFWKKNQKLLLMFYLYKKDVERKDFVIEHSLLYKYPIEDLVIIKKDFEKIIEKINSGNAHELSEADTMYLGACSKGKSSKTLRPQPFSNQLAMQRAFSLKQSYMTEVLRKYVLGSEENESIIKNVDELTNISFEDYIINKISKHYGVKRTTLVHQFDLDINAKHVNEIIISRILECEGKVSKSDEFIKSGIVVKTIRYNPDKPIKEHMSFPVFRFNEVANQEWYDSDLYEMFECTKWLFIIYEETDADYVLSKAFFWKIPIDILEKEIRLVWEKTKSILNEGVILTKKGKEVKNNLPKASDSRFCHVRPHASKASYEAYNANADMLPDGRWMTKQSFWLDRKYITRIVKDNL